jgi:FkbM family methyltransferase
VPDFKPQYLFRPLRLVHRLRVRSAQLPTDERVTSQLPWGLELTHWADDAIGYGIRAARVFDLAVTETLFRLVSPGATCVDVGAHVGYMSSVMAARAGDLGRVWAFEAHPNNASLLSANSTRWMEEHRLDVTPVEVAVSDRSGRRDLFVDRSAFQNNTGIASMEPIFEDAHDLATIPVEVTTLDAFFRRTTIDVLKIDVEGHESAVIEGAHHLISGKKIRHIVFEHQASYPNETTRFLERSGFYIRAIDTGLARPILQHPGERSSARAGPSLLATQEPDRAAAAMRPLGWRALRRTLPRATPTRES